MILQDDEYKIENDGIWISKKALEEWKEHYLKVSDNHKQDFVKSKDNIKFPYFLGKSGVLSDLLKMFEDLEGE